MPTWVEIAVHTPGDWVEAVSYALREMGAGGVAIDDPGPLWNLAGAEPEIRPDFLPEPGALAVVKAYFQQGSEKEKLPALKDFLAEAGISGVRVETREVQEEDWQDAWKAYYKPVSIGKHLVIKPTWEEYSTRGDEIIIHMDPGQAFGTGTHPTTAMCLEMIEEFIKPGDKVVDVGTGSGILAIAAARMGAAKVMAVDSDPVAVGAARENVRRNGLDAAVEVREGNLLDNVGGRFQLVIANILSSVIKELAPEAAGVLEAGGHFIASGIIKERLPEIRSVLEKTGFVIEKICEQGEWVALAACAY